MSAITSQNHTYFFQQIHNLLASLRQQFLTKFVREKKFAGLPTTPLEYFLSYINQQVKNQVSYGSFAGMKYISESIGSAHYPKLLGTYELELYPVIEEICNINFDKIINVGAGEGYYSVGLALRNRHAQVIAFESDAQGKELIQKMAELNDISERLSLHGNCDLKSLASALSDNENCLLFMDCEGEEGNLLDQNACPSLKNTTIIVELHPFNFPNVDQIITSRFQDTHQITEIHTRPRTVADFPIKISKLISLLFKKDILNILNENRQIQMSFLYLTPKNI